MEDAAAIQLRFDPNHSAVQFYQCFGNGEPEPRALGLRAADLGNLIKLLEDPLSLIQSDARSIVGNRNLNPLVPVTRHRDGDPTTRWNKLSRVADQVHQ